MCCETGENRSGVLHSSSEVLSAHRSAPACELRAHLAVRTGIQVNVLHVLSKARMEQAVEDRGVWLQAGAQPQHAATKAACCHGNLGTCLARGNPRVAFGKRAMLHLHLKLATGSVASKRARSKCA